MSNTAKAAAQWALSKVGCAYSQVKRTKENIFDCSSLVARAYSAQGKKWKYGGSVPISMYEVYDDEFELLWPDSYSKIGKSFGGKSVINLAKQEGDLQFACTDSDTTRNNRITHVTMVASDSQIVHARSTKYGVRTDSISLYSGKICAVTRYNPSCDLRVGMCGWRTLELQEALNQNGAGITVDGEFGSNTQTAVKEYQKAHGLKETGIADAELLKQLQLIENEQEEQKLETNDVLVRVTGNSVNLRTGPGTEYESAGIVHKGELLRKVDTEGWSGVEQEGHLYWISDRYVAQQDEV